LEDEDQYCVGHDQLNHLLSSGSLSELDFGVIEHGFLPHGRDYRFVIEDSLCIDPGTYELIFTHVVDLRYETRVSDASWQQSWSDDFTNYAQWVQAGEPEGYVFGTDWSLAYPGMSVDDASPEAAKWSERLQRPMFFTKVETDRFNIALVFSGVQHRKLSSSVAVLKQVLIPLGPSNKDQS
jgi:hypothetical protein